MVAKASLADMRQTDNTWPMHMNQRKRTHMYWDQAQRCPTDVLPTWRLHLLKVPEASQTALPTKDQMFTYKNLRGTFLIQTSTIPNSLACFVFKLCFFAFPPNESHFYILFFLAPGFVGSDPPWCNQMVEMSLGRDWFYSLIYSIITWVPFDPGALC